MVPAVSAGVGQGSGLLELVSRVTWQNEDRRLGGEEEEGIMPET